MDVQIGSAPGEATQQGGLGTSKRTVVGADERWVVSRGIIQVEGVKVGPGQYPQWKTQQRGDGRGHTGVVGQGQGGTAMNMRCRSGFC